MGIIGQRMMFGVVTSWMFFGGVVTIPLYTIGSLLKVVGCRDIGNQICETFGWNFIAKIGIMIMKPNIVRITSTSLIDKGYILANHRSWADFVLDLYLSKSSGISRIMVAVPLGFTGIQSLIENRIIYIRRGKSQATDVLKSMVSLMESKSVDRILFFPEGSRMKYTSLDSPEDLEKYIRKGLLLTTYQYERDRPDPLPFQIQIMSNKEFVVNEKKMILNRGVDVKYILSDPIYPNKFATDELFLAEIRRVWYDCYRLTHD